jgi:hypothetical protein
MSAPVGEREALESLKYAPPWARARAAAVAVDDGPADRKPAASASGAVRNPPGWDLPKRAPPGKRRVSEQFEGDIGIMELRAKLALNPDQVPEPSLGTQSAPSLGRIRSVAFTALWPLAVIGALGSGGAWALLLLSSVPQPEAPAQALHLVSYETGAPPTQYAAASIVETTTPVPVSATPVSVEPPPNRDEILALITRGQKYFAAGDIAAARLVLRPAALAGDSTAALALGATYDPTVLKELGVIGVAGELALARRTPTTRTAGRARSLAEPQRQEAAKRHRGQSSAAVVIRISDLRDHLRASGRVWISLSHQERECQRDNQRQHQWPGSVLREFQGTLFNPGFELPTDPHTRPLNHDPAHDKHDAVHNGCRCSNAVGHNHIRSRAEG